MFLVYSPQESPRLQYILDLIFHSLLGIDYSITSSISTFKNFKGPKLNYSRQSFEDEISIYPARLLFEKGIAEQEIKTTDWGEIKGLFPSPLKMEIPFDLFAASFYLVSRYEEYLPHLRDVHNRFLARESLAFKLGLLEKPLINIWVKKLRQILKTRYPSLVFSEESYRFISSFDIDNAYAYKEKGLVRTSGAYVKDLVRLNISQIKDRTKVLLGFKKDPYDTYELQLSLMQQYKFQSIYFFLVGEYGENDKNISLESRKYQSLIKSIADYCDVGLHPSYASNFNSRKLKRELNKLAKVLKRDVTKSRQHFLKLVLPDTYRTLIDLDIFEDYTMGYASDIGFRASICSPFFFYDLDLEIITPLKIFPFAVMDATLKYYLKLSPDKAFAAIKPLVDEVKEVNGTFISLWHNESLCESMHWKGWKDVYEQMVNYAR